MDEAASPEIDLFLSSYHWTFSQNDFVKGIVKHTHKLTWQVQIKPFANRNLDINDDRQKQRDAKSRELRYSYKPEIYVYENTDNRV